MIKLDLSELKKSKENLSDIKSEERPVVQKKPNIDKLGRSYGTGKRKNAVSRVWIKRGKGLITVNTKNVSEYFVRSALESLIREPLNIANLGDQIDCRKEKTRTKKSS